MEEKIGGRIGWSVDKVQKTVTLCSRIPPQILVLAKTFQKGRGGCFPPNGGINDHSANTFDSTEAINASRDRLAEREWLEPEKTEKREEVII